MDEGDFRYDTPFSYSSISFNSLGFLRQAVAAGGASGFSITQSARATVYTARRGSKIEKKANIVQSDG